MADIPLPFFGINLSTDGGAANILMTFVMVVLGFAALFLAEDLGRSVKGTVSQTLGVGSESGQDTENALFVI